MKEAIHCYLVKPSGSSRFWKMRFTLPGQDETQRTLEVRDERSARRKMENFIIEQERIAAGILPSLKLREASNAKIEVLLRAHLDDLQAQNCAPEHVVNRGLLIRRMARDAKWITIRDITAESFVSWRAGLSKLSARTLNNYLAELRAFVNWLENTGRLPGNSLKGIQRVKQHVKARPRRAICDEEISALLTVAPPKRRIIYLIAFHTGLRRKELKFLEWQDVFLDVPSPFIRLRAATTKNRKGGQVTVHPELCEELRMMRNDTTPPCSRVVNMFSGLAPFKKDLAAAGIPFIDEREFRFDLHATRKTFNTRMAIGNIPTRIAMQAMRHSDEKLTTVVYTDASMLNVAAHVCNLPALQIPGVVSARASGKSETRGDTGPLIDTTGHLAIDLEAPYNQEFSHTLTQSGTLCISWEKSSLTRTRT